MAVTDEQIEATILGLLAQRDAGKTICPSDAARALADDFRPLMEPVRRVARELAARFHGAAAAETAVAGWNAAVRGEGDTAALPLTDVVVAADGVRIAALLTAAGLTPSNSEANRKLKERAVRIDGEVVEDAQRVFTPGFEGVLAVGKRNFARVRLVEGALTAG